MVLQEFRVLQASSLNPEALNPKPHRSAAQTPGRIQKVDPLLGVPIKYPY